MLWSLDRKPRLDKGQKWTNNERIRQSNKLSFELVTDVLKHFIYNMGGIGKSLNLLTKTTTTVATSIGMDYTKGNQIANGLLSKNPKHSGVPEEYFIPPERNS